MGILHEFLRKHLYRKSSGIICQTQYSQKFLYSVTKHKNIVTIPNPISFSKQNSDTLENKEKVIITVGRLIKSKNIDLLLEMFALLGNSEWKLWIVGDGPEKENLIQLSNSLQLTERVVFWGKRQDVDQFYSKSSIFAFTSESEGFPNALLEAMSFSLPSISFDCIAGPSDLIDHEINGYLIPLKDIKSYSEKLQNLTDSADLRKDFGIKAKIKAQEFQIDKIGEQYFEFIAR